MPDSRSNYKAPEGERMVTTCMRIPGSLRDALRDEARRTGCSMGLLMIGALEAFIQAGGADEVRNA